ncbi:MAG TPA: NDP-hexose 4-ketoreductase, partial [Anaerolineales bacterium]|nr:NDP-hexose 4-ketoreductase [Anaerolineales bacterium]
VSKRLDEYEIKLHATDEARTKLADLGYDPEMGARPLRRVIQNQIEDQLSDELLIGRFAAGDEIGVDVEDDEIILRLAAEEPEDAQQTAVPAG